MCCCGKPVVNGEQGYRWTPDASPHIYPMNPPDVYSDDVILFDEPGRCGGLDCHSYHYRVVNRNFGGHRLLVRHGGGDESIRISGSKMFVDALSVLDSNSRYWVLSAMYFAQSDAARKAQEDERTRWQKAAAQGRIKTRKQRNSDYVKVWLEPMLVQAGERSESQ